jgi:1-acyl-sn-glycerol-3-phosphate acyltransferase
VEPLFEGAAYLAGRAGVPIVPVGIGGSERAMPKGARFIRPVKVVVVVGEPLWVESVEGVRVPREATRELTTRLHTELQRLFDVAQIRAG